MMSLWLVMFLLGRICCLLCKEEGLRVSLATRGVATVSMVPIGPAGCRVPLSGSRTSRIECLGRSTRAATPVPLHSLIRAHMIDDPLNPEKRRLGVN